MSLLDDRKVPRAVSRNGRRASAVEVTYYKTAADSLAADTTSLGFLDAQQNYSIVAASYVPHYVLTAHASNFATIAIKVGAATLASVTTEITGSGDFVLNTPVDLTLASAVDIDEGDVVLFDIAKAASGVAVPAGILSVTLVER